MNSAYDGENSDTAGECSPCLNAYRITLNVKKLSSAIRAHAPSVGIHLPTPNDRIAAHTPNQMNASENRYCPTLPEVTEERVERRDRGDAQQAAHPDRVRQPVQDRVDRGHEAAPGELRPHVAAALVGERRAQLGGQQRVRHEEEDRQHDQPREALRPVAGDRAERVHTDERADQEEQHVEAPEVLLELRLLVERRLRLDDHCLCCVRFQRHEPIPPDSSERWMGPAVQS